MIQSFLRKAAISAGECEGRGRPQRCRAVTRRYAGLFHLALVLATPAAAQATATRSFDDCRAWAPKDLVVNPSEAELRCRWGITGEGRFGLVSYSDVPVYQPTTPMPGTHIVGVPGLTGPRPGESFEAWEWRMLRTEFGPEARTPQTDLELLHPFAASRIMRLEKALRAEGIPVVRLETWRSPDRQAHLFQQGRSRPGPLATATLTSWHCQYDAQGIPAGRAVDYRVPWSQMKRFHEIVDSLGLASFGADSNDPGHVYLPLPEAVDDMEIVLLRLLPRVPVVTLATGIPVDQPVPAGGRAALRRAVADFVESAYVPEVRPEVSRPTSPVRIAKAPKECCAAPEVETEPRRSLPGRTMDWLAAWLSGW
jgi:hypothetical protein